MLLVINTKHINSIYIWLNIFIKFIKDMNI